MAKGISLHIGVARPRFEPPAKGADVSARVLHDIARTKRFAAVDQFGGLLIDGDATRENLDGCLRLAERELDGGDGSDILLLTFTGHGLVRQGVREEPTDQSMVLSDTEWLDNDVYDFLLTIDVAARVLLIVDACFSGSIHHLPVDAFVPQSAPVSTFQQVTRRLNDEETSAYLRSRDGWQHYAETFPRRLRPPLTANVLLLASSEDTTTTTGSRREREAPPFTRALAAVWQDSANYRDLRSRIEDHLFRNHPLAIAPVLNDKLVSNPAFVSEAPFTI